MSDFLDLLLSKGPELLYTFQDELDPAHDSSGNANHGTVFGTLGRTDSPLEDLTAIKFSDGGLVQTPSGLGFNSGGPFTLVMLWVIDNAGYYLFGNESDTFEVYQYSGVRMGVYVQLVSGTPGYRNAQTTGSWPVLTPYLFTLRYDGTDFTVSFDDVHEVLVAGQADGHSPQPLDIPGPWTFGGYATAHPSYGMQGSLTVGALWDSVLTDADVDSFVAAYQAELRPPPPNDNLADATEVVLTAGEYTSPRSDVATITEEDPEESALPDIFGYNSMWWKFTPTDSGVYTMDTNGSDEIDTTLHMFVGGPAMADLVFVDDDDDGGDGSRSQLDKQLVAGTTYYFRAGTYSESTAGAIVFHVLQGPTSPDILGLARVISGTDGSYSRLAAGLGIETDEPHVSPGDRSAWFEWTPSDDPSLERFYSSSADLYVYKVNPFPAFTPTDYFTDPQHVYDFEETSGTVVTDTGTVPVNGDYRGAPYLAQGSLAGVGRSVVTGPPAGPSTGWVRIPRTSSVSFTVSFYFQPLTESASLLYTDDLTVDYYGGYLYVYFRTDTAPGLRSFVVPGPGLVTLTYDGASLKVYHGTSLVFTEAHTGPMPNDPANWYFGSPGDYSSSYVTALDKLVITDYAATLAEITAFFEATAPGEQEVPAPAFSNLLEVASGTGEIYLQPTANQTYYIQAVVDSGATVLDLVWEDATPPANDAFESSQFISGGRGSEVAQLGGSSTQVGETLPASADRSVWYTWEAPATSTVTFKVSSGKVTVFTGDTLGTLAQLAPAAPSVTFAATQGTLYRVQVAEES